MRAVRANLHEGMMIIREIGDPRWPEPGWAKYTQHFIYHDALGYKRGIEIHYLWNQRLNLFDDFKFK